MDFFLYFNPKNHYNSFIFGSSRANGINSYHWKTHIDSDARQFLFQGYAQNISGIDDKVRFLEKNGNNIDNALILIDIPSTFAENQTPLDPVKIRDYRLSGQNKVIYHLCRFGAFLRKPSEWCVALKCQPMIAMIDTFSNEFGFEKRSMNVTVPPEKECMRSCSEAVRISVLREIENTQFKEDTISDPLINSIMEEKLNSICQVFDRQHTDCKIVITPMIYPLYQSINPDDLKLLREKFGEENVYDYSGKNFITTDYCYFSDPLHFNQSAGWWIVEEIFGNIHYPNGDTCNK